MRLLLAIFFLLAPAFAFNHWDELAIEYIGITQPQARQIDANNLAFYNWSEPKEARAKQVEAELADEGQKVPPDPLALGLRFAEVEALRREVREGIDRLTAQNRALLTPAQLVRLNDLEKARALADPLQSANCLQVLRPVDKSPCGSLYSDTDATAAPKPPVETVSVEAYLQLTPQQLAALEASNQNYRSLAQQLNQVSACQERDFNLALTASPLNPILIGLAKTNAITARRDLAKRREEQVKANQALLTPPQLARLEILNEARRLSDTVFRAEQSNLLFGEAPPSVGFYVSGLPGGFPCGLIQIAP